MSFGSFWEDVGDFFENLGALIGGAMLVFLKAGAEAIVASGGELLKDAAMAAVRASEAQGGDGEEKFSAAVKAVIGTLESAGIAVVINAVRLAIEHAVARLHVEQGKANPLVVPPGA